MPACSEIALAIESSLIEGHALSGESTSSDQSIESVKAIAAQVRITLRSYSSSRTLHGVAIIGPVFQFNSQCTFILPSSSSADLKGILKGLKGT